MYHFSVMHCLAFAKLTAPNRSRKPHLCLTVRRNRLNEYRELNPQSVCNLTIVYFDKSVFISISKWRRIDDSDNSWCVFGCSANCSIFSFIFLKHCCQQYVTTMSVRRKCWLTNTLFWGLWFEPFRSWTIVNISKKYDLKISFF